MAGAWCLCSLLRILPDSSPRVSSSLYPDMSSIASDAWSQYSPLPIVSCVDAPDKKTIFAKIQITVWCLFLGHIWNEGRRSHSVDTPLGSVLRIRAILVPVHSQISCPTPHTVRRCSMVSCLPNLVQLSESFTRILLCSVSECLVCCTYLGADWIWIGRREKSLNTFLYQKIFSLRYNITYVHGLMEWK